MLKPYKAEKGSTSSLPSELNQNLVLAMGWLLLPGNCFSLYPDQHFKAHHFIGLTLRAEQSQSSLKDVTVVLPQDE